MFPYGIYIVPSTQEVTISVLMPEFSRYVENGMRPERLQGNRNEISFIDLSVFVRAFPKSTSY